MTGTGEPVNMVLMALNRKRLEQRERIRKILSGEIPLDDSPVTKLSIEEQKRLGIPTDSVSMDLNPLKRD